MVIKNVMDIHANWKWGNILPKRNPKKVQGKLDKEMLEDDTLMKFPPEDPRTPKRFGKKKVEVSGDDKKEIYSSCINYAKEDDKEKAEKIKDTEIQISEQQKMVDTDEEEKKNSES